MFKKRRVHQRAKFIKGENVIRRKWDKMIEEGEN